MELFYRQFILYLGMSVFPLIVFLVIIVNLLEYPLDKLRLLKLSYETKKVTGSSGVYLALFLSTMAVLGIVVWPDGGLYSLAGGWIQRSYYCPCSIFGTHFNCSATLNNLSSSSAV
jgi:hypothetical protein